MSFVQKTDCDSDCSAESSTALLTRPWNKILMKLITIFHLSITATLLHLEKNISIGISARNPGLVGLCISIKSIVADILWCCSRCKQILIKYNILFHWHLPSLHRGFPPFSGQLQSLRLARCWPRKTEKRFECERWCWNLQGKQDEQNKKINMQVL